MASINMYNLDDSDMTRTANQVMELIEHRLYQDGIISEPDAISKRYVIQLVRPGVLSSWFDKTFLGGKKNNQAIYKIFNVS